MKLSAFLYFHIVRLEKDSILVTIIVTNKCNLNCKYCTESNITFVMHPYEHIRAEMERLYLRCI